MDRRTPARTALLASFVLAALLLIPAGASATHFANSGTTSNCNPAPSTDCTLNVQLRSDLTYNNTTISVQLDPGYTFAAVPGIGANNCAITPTVTLQNPTLAFIYFAGFSPPCTFGLVEKLAFTSTPAPTTLPCQTFDTSGNSPPFYICSTADTLAPPLPTIASAPNSPNPSTTPNIRGTAEPFSTVRLYASGDCSGAVADTSTAAAYNSPGFAVIVPADTSASFSTTATDAAGNTSFCSSTFTYTSDTIAPNEPTLDTISPASPANTRTLLITGTAEAGSTVRLFATADCSGPSLVSGTSGAYASSGLGFTLSSDGTRTYHATSTDAAGNASPCSTDSITHTVDTVAPPTPAISGSSPASPADSGKPEIGGTADVGTVVRLYLTANCAGPVAASGTAADFGAEGITLSVPSDATSLISARTVDDAGNLSTCSNSIAYTEDSTTPGAPSLTGFDPAPPASSNAPRVKGTAEAGSTVRLYTTATCTGTPEAVGSAAVFATPGLLASVTPDQTTTFYATTTDAAGHTSACSSGLAYEEDSTAPAMPTIDGVDPTSPANDNSVTVSGTAAAGTTVRIYATADCSGPSEQSGSGADFAAPGLTVDVADDSTTALRATATDAAGNTSACSAPVSYVEDSTAPAAPGVTASSPASPAGDNSPWLRGTAAPGSTVSIYTTSDCTGTPVGNGSAAAFADPGLQVSATSDTTTTYYASATDDTDNTSACSSGLAYEEDSTAPEMPTLTATAPASPSNDNTPRVTGTAEAGSTVKLYTTGDCTGTAAASGGAAAFADPGLGVTVGSDQTTTFRATATDAAGNTSGCSSSGVDYTEDSTAPSAPELSSTSPTSPADHNRPAIKGTEPAGSTIRIYASATCSGDAVASGSAATLAGAGLEVLVADDSQTAFTALASDASGNTSVCSVAIAYVERTTPAPAAPAAPVAPVASVAPAAPAAPARDVLAPKSRISAITRKEGRTRRVTLRGTADGTGSAVRSVGVSVARQAGTKCRFLTANGTFAKARSCARTTYLNTRGTGTWRRALRTLPRGTYKVRSRAIDAAGNVERKDASRNLRRFVL